VKDLLFINSLDGTLVVLDAKNGSTVWSRQPTPASGTNGTLAQGGVTSAPAIDPARQHVFAYGLDGNVHKYQVGDGTEILTNGTTVGKTDGWPEISTAKPDSEKGAGGIAIATTSGSINYLYAVMDGYDGDGGDYQGHLTTVNLATGAQNVFNSECSSLTIHFIKNGTTSGSNQNDCASRQNGIWGRPGAIYDPGTNRVFITTGNGPFNANAGGLNWGDSVLALNADGTGSGGGMPLDSYTPSSFANLQGTDADLGSTSLAILPAPTGSHVAHLGLQGGKDGCVRLLKLNDLSGAGGSAHVGGELQAQTLPNNTDHCTDGGNSSTFKTQAAVWVNTADVPPSTWAYVGHNAGIVGYKIALTAGAPTLSKVWSSTNSGTSPVVANGQVYYVSSGHVRVLDATKSDVSGNPTSIWSDAAIGSIHWQSPIVVNGRLYIVDSTSKLWVYQLDGIFKNGFG
jgi:hypothetical protein